MTLWMVAHARDALIPHRIPWIRHVQAQGWDVVALFPEGQAPAEPFPARIHTFPYDRRTLLPYRMWPSVHALRKIVRRDPPDLVHAFSLRLGVYTAQAMGPAAREKLVVWFEGLGSAFLPGAGWRRRVYHILARRAVRWLGNRARAFVALNADDRDLLQALVRTFPVFVVPGVGIDLDAWHPRRCHGRHRWRRDRGVVEHTWVVLYAGRMIADKGVRVLRDAWLELRQLPDAQLWLVGDVDPANPSSLTDEELHRWMDEDPRIRWWGYQAPLLPWLCAADVVVLPSFREGLPRLVLEALALERPVVVTDVPGNRTLVPSRAHGWRIPSGDVRALADTLLQVYRQPDEAQRRGQTGRQWVARHFALPRVLDAIDTLHRTLESKA